MHQTTVVHPGICKAKKVFHASVPCLTQPTLTNRTKVISKPVVDGNMIKEVNVLHYVGENGALYVADLFDKMFGVQRSPMNLNQKKDELGMISLNQF